MHTPLQRWVDSWKRGIKYGTGGTRRRRIDCSKYMLVEWTFIHHRMFLGMQIALTAGPGQEWISRFTFMVTFVWCQRWHWVYGKFAHEHQHYRWPRPRNLSRMCLGGGAVLGCGMILNGKVMITGLGNQFEMSNAL